MLFVFLSAALNGVILSDRRERRISPECHPEQSEGSHEFLCYTQDRLHRFVPQNDRTGLGFSCALCLSHLQESVSEESCSNAAGELSVEWITAIDILFLVPDTFSRLNP